MHRQHLIELLARYERVHPEERELVHRFRTFASEHGDCLLRSCVPGHITASAWIISRDGTRCLLTHHRKLDRWLQLGGHVDGESRIEEAARREALEESGLGAVELVLPRGFLVPLDLDVHPIPARGNEPLHLHWDVRFLFRAAGTSEVPVVSEESHDVKWFTTTELHAVTDEESVLRLHRKARALTGGA